MKHYFDIKFEELFQRLTTESDFSFLKLNSLEELTNFESKLDNLSFSGKMVLISFIFFTRLIISFVFFRVRYLKQLQLRESIITTCTVKYQQF